MTRAVKISRIDSLQFLRGVAATLVAAFHLDKAARSEGFDPGIFAWFKNGEAGVDLFFVLSGFIIYFVSARRAGQGAKAFAAARFWRILPPYWVILVLYVAAYMLNAVLFGDSSQVPTVSRLINSFLLLPVPDHVIVIAWTLAIEILFYLLFAATYFRFGDKVFFASMILWAIAAQIFTHTVDTKPVWLLMPLNTVVLEFLYGAVIAWCYLKLAPRWQIPVLIIGVLGMCYSLSIEGALESKIGREFLFGVPAALIVYGLAGIGVKLPEWIVNWGESSYTLYLVHILVYLFAGKVFEIVTGINPYSSPGAMGLLLLAATVSAYIYTVVVEQRYQRWYKKRLTR